MAMQSDSQCKGTDALLAVDGRKRQLGLVLCFLLSPDTGWVTRGTPGHDKTVPLIPSDSLLEHVKEVDPTEND